MPSCSGFDRVMPMSQQARTNGPQRSLRRPALQGLVRPVCGVVAAVLLIAALPASAQWRWRDASGRVTASDLPPPREIPEKDILQRPGNANRPAVVTAAPAAAASAAPVAPKPVVDKELEARKRAAEQQLKDKAKADEERAAATRAENCRRARQHLATLDSGQRMARINDKGEREILDDSARADEVRRAREVIASDCR